MKKKFSKIFLHIIGCVSFLSLPVIFSPDFSTSFDFLHRRGFQQDFFNYTLLLVYFYAGYYYLVPHLYFKKKYLYYIIVIAVTFFFIGLAGEFIFSGGGRPVKPPRFEFNHPPPPHQFRPFGWLFKVGRYLIEFGITTLLPLMLRINLRWKQVEQEKTSTELSFLKAQINPHFLFNSLNSIYSLTIEENATKSSESIIKLSHMMRYVLSESQQEFVPLEKEISYINNYLDLQKVRLVNTVQINFHTKGQMQGYRIAPLILIPFIENAFKYGVNPETASTIDITIVLENDELKLQVKNAKVRLNISKTEQQGIGIANTRNRLRLLYADKHSLLIKDSATDYHVTLSLLLK